MLKKVELTHAKDDLPKNRSLLARTLARAFQKDPFYRYITPNPATRLSAQEWWFSVLLKYTATQGVIDRLPHAPAAAALWLGPDRPMASTFGLLASGLYSVPFRLGAKGLVRLFSISEQWGKRHQREPKRHYYLMVIGVEPEMQGKGLGRELLNEGLNRADRDGLSCYLETSQVKNRDFYQRLGFKVLDEVKVPASEGDWTYWTMRRDPACA